MSRTVLVTGGAQGIGRGIVERFLESGHRVFLTDINAAAGEAAARETGAGFFAQDVADEASWLAVIEAIGREAGGLHVLVNNAGTEGKGTAAKDVETAPADDWRRIMDVNTSSVFLGCKHAIPLMAKSGGGAIVNMASVASLVPTPFLAAYGASKAAVEHLTRSIALHCGRAGHAIRCNSVHPGHVMTPMLTAIMERLGGENGMSGPDFAEKFRQSLPLRSFQDVRDMANLVHFLASDDARFITGQSIAVDSGFVLAN